MLRLYAEDLHYLGETEKERQRDCCVHGRIVFSVGDTVIEGDGEWCAGASALRFLRSVSSDHFSGAEEHTCEWYWHKNSNSPVISTILRR